MRSYRLTALCLCTVIGAGFATGKELMAYFAVYGRMGFIGVFIACVLFTLVIQRVLALPCNSLEELLSQYSGGNAVLILMRLFLIVLYSAMLSAAGETISAIFGINAFVASVITAVLAGIISLRGYNAVAAAGSFMFAPMLIVIFVISIAAAGRTAFPSEDMLTFGSLLSPIVYVSYNMLTFVPLLISIPDRYMYKSCARDTGTVLFIVMSMLLIPLYANYSLLRGEPLPIMALIGDMSPAIRYLYRVLLGFAVFTTAVSALYSLNSADIGLPSPAGIIIINVAALALSLIGFESIVERVYFIFGVLGIVLMAAVFAGVRE